RRAGSPELGRPLKLRVCRSVVPGDAQRIRPMLPRIALDTAAPRFLAGDPLGDLDGDVGEKQRPPRAVTGRVDALFAQELDEAGAMERGVVAHQRQPLLLRAALEPRPERRLQ